MNLEDSVVALSSGRLPSGIAIVRISGPGTRFAVETILGHLPRPRIASLGALRSSDGTTIDTGLTLFFPGPHSFTGEDTAEFHIHGGKATVAALLERIAELNGFRFAEPGEFTRRAFLNGKLDLLTAEALGDLISAETEAQRRFAIQNSQGKQSALYLGWRRRLIHARAMIEAEMDFSDEADIPESIGETVWRDVDCMLEEIAHHIAGYGRAEIIRDGYHVVIIGAPNAGKSSLLNALAQRDAAIVTDEPGTTRDLIEISMDIHGLKVHLTDTAGIRKAEGKSEAIGIERAMEKARSADLIVYLQDLLLPVTVGDLPDGAKVLRVGTKLDLLPKDAVARAREMYDFVVSSALGTNIDQLVEAIGGCAADAVGNVGDILPSRERHVGLLVECEEFLRSAFQATIEPLELRCENLRMASDSLGRIAGAVDVEDLLDVIFSRFCIGK